MSTDLGLQAALGVAAEAIVEHGSAKIIRDDEKGGYIVEAYQMRFPDPVRVFTLDAQGYLLSVH